MQSPRHTESIRLRVATPFGEHAFVTIPANVHYTPSWDIILREICNSQRAKKPRPFNAIVRGLAHSTEQRNGYYDGIRKIVEANPDLLTTERAGPRGGLVVLFRDAVAAGDHAHDAQTELPWQQAEFNWRNFED